MPQQLWLVVMNLVAFFWGEYVYYCWPESMIDKYRLHIFLFYWAIIVLTPWEKIRFVTIDLARPHDE